MVEQHSSGLVMSTKSTCVMQEAGAPIAKAWRHNNKPAITVVACSSRASQAAELQRPMVPTAAGPRLTGNVGQQGLCSADVAGRLVAPDVLLPGLHGHAQR